METAFREKIDRSLNNIFGKAADAIRPEDRHDISGDLIETGHMAAAYQRFCWYLSSRKGDIRRSLYPALAINYHSPEGDDRKQHINRVFRTQRRALVLFLFANAIFATVNAHLLSDDRLHPIAAAVPIQLFYVLALMHRATLGSGLLFRSSFDSIFKDYYGEELKWRVGVLLGGEFSPARHAVRSAVEVLLVMMLYFTPVYVTLQWLGGAAPLPEDVAGMGLVWRFIDATVMLFAFLTLRKSNLEAANIFQQEIDTLEPGQALSV